MKKSVFRFCMLFLPVISFALVSYIPRSTGSPGGKTGSPGDSKATCTQCHSGTATEKEDWITSNIPETGYVPGDVYTITLAAEHTGVQKMGFELTSEDASGAKVGTLDTDENPQMQLVNSNHAITHTGSGTTPTDGAKSWSFKWQAPESGSGDITFYAAINAANGNSSTSGDQIYTTKLSVSEQIDNSIDQYLLEGWVRVFPNPAVDNIKVKINGLVRENLDCSFYNINGQLIKKSKLVLNGSSRLLTIPVGDLPSGNYIIHMDGAELKLKAKFSIIK